MEGLFITFEGNDGSGKDSAIATIERQLIDRGIDFISTREPGGTPISEKIRDIILDPSTPEMDPATEALLYAASRTQHVKEKILPALQEGKIVLCNRFIDSSFAYQATARRLGLNEVAAINDFGIDGLRPDFVFFFDIHPEDSLARIKRDFDRLEKENIKFHQSAYDYFKSQIENNPSYIRIDATKTPLAVKEEVWYYFKKILNI